VPYCHLWPAPLYIIFPPYSIKGTILGGKKVEHKIDVFIFSKTFLFLRRTEQDVIKNVYWS
jgi:hypothetical protein